MHTHSDCHLLQAGELLGSVLDLKGQVEDILDTLGSVGDKAARFIKVITARITLLPQNVLDKSVFLSNAINHAKTKSIHEDRLTFR